MPLITLLASLLDPRLKFGPGLAQQDKDHLWAIILHQMIGMDRIRMNRPDNNNHHQQQQQQPLLLKIMATTTTMMMSFLTCLMS
jgi:hypothetical protein